MKVLIIGSAGKHTLESYYRKAFIELELSVELFPIRDMWQEGVHRNLLTRIGYNLSPGLFVSGLNRQLLDYVKGRSFDMVLIFKGMELMPRTVRLLKEFTEALVIYNPDHPFIYSGRGSGNQWMKDSIRYYDLYLTYTGEIRDQLLSKDVRSEVVPFGHFLSESRFSYIPDSDEIRKVCFIGGGDPGRTAFLNNLIKAGLPVVVYGDGWNRGLDSRIERKPSVWGKDLWMAMRRYRIQLNMMRPHNLNSHNMRTFEIPAAGGVQLAPRTVDHESFFIDREEILLYDNVEDCIDICRRVLSYNDGLIKLRSAARLRSIKSGYSYIDRAQLMLEHVKMAMA